MRPQPAPSAMTDAPSPTPATPAPVTAAMIVIGDEILSGRTQDSNFAYLAKFLGALGIDLKEGRFVPDVEAEIVAAVNALRARYTYVFTSGGIGPTHDDITADAIAAAFGVGIDYHPEALEMLGARYKPGEFNEMRKRMARVPDGATLITNTVSTAPGFQIGNVFVMAGVPMILRAMLENVEPRLTRGTRVISATVSARIAEGRMAAALAQDTERPQIRRDRQLSLLSRGRLRRAAGRARARCGRGRSGGPGRSRARFAPRVSSPNDCPRKPKNGVKL